MANMTFLAVMNGTRAYQDSAGSGTIDNDGTAVSYATGYWAGTQGALVPSAGTNPRLTIPGTSLSTKIDPTVGSMVVRCIKTDNPGLLAYLTTFGGYNVAAQQFIGIRRTNAGAVQALHKSGTSADNTLSGGTMAEDANVFVYMQWNGTAYGIQVNNGALTTGTRTAPQSAFSTSADAGFGMRGDSPSSYLEGRFDAIAVFDAPLTTEEITSLYNATAPWTWDMPLSNSDPVVDAGAGTASADTATPFTRSGSFTDADVSTSWTATVDYDDGDGEEPLTLDGFDFDLSHLYTAAGEYTVVVTVTDDGDLFGTDTITVTVTEAPVLGVYIVSGVTGTDASAPIVTIT